MAAAEARFRVMASDAQVIVVDGPPESCNAAIGALGELEAVWSRFVAGSDIDRLNHGSGRPIAVTEPTLTLIQAMTEAWRMTGGRYDPTTLPALLEAGYRCSIDGSDAKTTVPTAIQAGQLNEVIVDAGMQTVSVPAGTTLDAGGIGKGLAADLVVAELLSRGAAGALVSIGGDMAAAGAAPTADGWYVRVEDPFDQARLLTTVHVSGGGVATSSTLSRTWETRHGVRNHHVIDPSTGQPSGTDLVAVTAIAPCGWQAEAMATALLLAGSGPMAVHADAYGVDAIGTTIGGQTIATGQLIDLVDNGART